MKKFKCKRMLLGFIGVVVFTSATRLVAEPVGPGDWSTARIFSIAQNKNMFSTDQITAIRDRYDLIIIEKGHGKYVNGALESVLSNDLDAAKIRAGRPETKVLFYWNSLLCYKHLYKSITDILEVHPDWAEVKDHYVFDYGWDLSNQDAKDWWAAEAINVVSNTACNGVFADAARVPQIPQYQTIRDAIDGPVIANCAFNYSYINATDGIFIERFVGYTIDTSEEIEERLDGCLAFPSDKYMLLWGRPENDVGGTDHQFSFACFLIVANDYSYYAYGGGTKYWPEDFEKPLGKPLGAAVKNGTVYTREYKHCTVTVDVRNLTSSIVWKTANKRDQFRDFTNSKGQAIKARLIGYDKRTGMVSLKRVDGRVGKLSIKMLCAADQKFIKSRVY